MERNSDTDLSPAVAAVGDYILRMPDVERVTGLARNTVWKRIRAGEFPQARDLGGGRVGWRASAIRAWLESLEESESARARHG